MSMYLAGKVGGAKWELWKALGGREHREGYLWWRELSGIRVEASDGTNHSEHLWGGGLSLAAIGNEDLRQSVKQYATEKIRGCRFLLAYLDRADSFGSIAEIAYASALGKPCFVVLLVPEQEEELVEGSENEYVYPWDGMKDAYWFVSCFPGVKSVVVESFEEAIDAARGYILLGVRAKTLREKGI